VQMTWFSSNAGEESNHNRGGIEGHHR